MKQKILVAGGTGYIGSHTTVELQNAGYEVVIIDDLSNSNIEVLDGIERITGIRPEFIKLDLKDKEGTREALKAHPGIKGIILFAASKAVGESAQQPLKYYRNKGSDQESGISLRKYKTDQRRDHPRHDPCRRSFQEHHPALLQPDRSTSDSRDRRIA